jgi:hypothetical protein
MHSEIPAWVDEPIVPSLTCRTGEVSASPPQLASLRRRTCRARRGTFLSATFPAGLTPSVPARPPSPGRNQLWAKPDERLSTPRGTGD